MKRIKYLGVLLSIVTLCVACEKSEKDGLGGFHKNFVELYVDGQIMLTEFQNECSGDAHRLSKKQIAGFVICIPSPKMYFFYGPDIEKFNRWAARNNDIEFNQVLANGALPMVATLADNFRKMSVTSKANWIPAGPRLSIFCRCAATLPPISYTTVTIWENISMNFCKITIISKPSKSVRRS